MRASRCGAMTSATRVVESDDPRFVRFRRPHGREIIVRRPTVVACSRARSRGTPGRACERARRHAAEDDPLETSDEHLGATRVDRVGGSSDGPRGVVPRGAISRTPAPGLDAGRTSARGDGDRARVRRLHGQVPRDGRLRPRLHGQGGGHATLARVPRRPATDAPVEIQTPTTRDPPDRLRARSFPFPSPLLPRVPSRRRG